METTHITTSQTIEAMYKLAKTNDEYALAEAAKAPKASHVILTMYAPKGATWANPETAATLRGKVWVVQGQGVYYYPSQQPAATVAAPDPAPAVAKEVVRVTNERQYDALVNEGGEGYNPYRKGAAQTYNSDSAKLSGLLRSSKKYKHWA